MKTETKEKLESMHLIPYLEYSCPIEVNVYGRITKGILITIGITEKTVMVTAKYKNGNWDRVGIKNIKPILRPLSDLTKDNGKDVYISSDELAHIIKYNEVKTLKYHLVEYLLEKHYDVFGLIEKGLAISYNDIN